MSLEGESGTLSFHLSVPVPVLIPSVVTSRPTTASRPSTPLDPSPLAPQIRHFRPLRAFINYIYFYILTCIQTGRWHLSVAMCFTPAHWRSSTLAWTVSPATAIYRALRTTFASFPVPRFPVLRFPVLQFDGAFSSLRFASPAVRSCDFHSRVFSSLASRLSWPFRALRTTQMLITSSATSLLRPHWATAPTPGSYTDTPSLSS